MIGLFFSELMLFAAAALVGFALGWRLHAMASAERRGDDKEEIETLRTALSEAQVRRARVP